MTAEADRASAGPVMRRRRSGSRRDRPEVSGPGWRRRPVGYAAAMADTAIVELDGTPVTTTPEHGPEAFRTLGRLEPTRPGTPLTPASC
jgi:hypothetical protein